MPRPTESRKVLIVGGGAAGMQAAITAADRGHKVTLVERSSELGGILKFTDKDVDKADLRDFKDLLVYETGIRDIKVQLDTSATAETIAEEVPDTVILAVGSSPLVPPIRGIENAIPALRVYDDDAVLGERIVMVGGGLVGCETGLHLAKSGHEVTVVEMLARAANESYGMYREALLLEIQKAGMKIITNAKCTEISRSGIQIECKDTIRDWLDADTVVYALGMCPNATDDLQTALGSIPYMKIGDCVRAAKVDAAIREGFLAAMDIL